MEHEDWVLRFGVSWCRPLSIIRRLAPRGERVKGGNSRLSAVTGHHRIYDNFLASNCQARPSICVQLPAETVGPIYFVGTILGPKPPVLWPKSVALAE